MEKHFTIVMWFSPLLFLSGTKELVVCNFDLPVSIPLFRFLAWEGTILILRIN